MKLYLQGVSQNTSIIVEYLLKLHCFQIVLFLTSPV